MQYISLFMTSIADSTYSCFNEDLNLKQFSPPCKIAHNYIPNNNGYANQPKILEMKPCYKAPIYVFPHTYKHTNFHGPYQLQIK